MSRIAFVRWLLAVAAAVTVAPTQAAEVAAPLNSRAALVQYIDQQAVQPLESRRRLIASITTPAEADARQASVRARLLALIGAPIHGIPLAAKITGASQGDGYRVENVLYDAQPGRHVTANLFLPASGRGPFPAVILAPGHIPSGKLSDYSFAANFARNGFVVLSYDIVGEGERLEYFDAQSSRSLGERPTGDHSLATYPALLTGEHVARHFIEDAMQGVDYLVSRPEVDAQRIGAFGCSGGGAITAYLAALDERIQATASACYVNDFSHLLASVGPQDAEQSIPDFIADGLDIPDWVELTAPKPYAVISTTEDMFPFAGAKAAVEETRHFWAAYGAAERMEWFSGPGPHGAIAPMGDRIIDFFRRALRPDFAQLPFRTLKPTRDEEVQVTPTGQLATSFGSATLADIERARVAAIAPKARPDAVVLRTALIGRARIRATPATAPGKLAISEASRDQSRANTMLLPSDMGWLEMRAVTPLRGATGRVMLLLDPTPLIALAQPGGRLEQLAAAGWTVVALQPRGVDGGGGAKSAIVGDQDLLALRLMLVGRTLPGIRIDDTIHAIDWIRQNLSHAPITLTGVGFMGPIALQAALLDSRVGAVRIERSPVSWRAAVESPTARDLPANAIPGVLADYDLPDVIAALAPRRVDVVVPVDPMGMPLGQKAFEQLIPSLQNVHYIANTGLQ